MIDGSSDNSGRVQRRSNSPGCLPVTADCMGLRAFERANVYEVNDGVNDEYGGILTTFDPKKLRIRSSGHWAVHTSAKEVMLSSLLVCLSVSNFAQKLPNGFA